MILLLFLASSTFSALSSFHKFLAFGLPKRSLAKCWTDTLPAYFRPIWLLCFILQASHWSTRLEDEWSEEFEVVPQLPWLSSTLDVGSYKADKWQISGGGNKTKRRCRKWEMVRKTKKKTWKSAPESGLQFIWKENVWSKNLERHSGLR